MLRFTALCAGLAVLAPGCPGRRPALAPGVFRLELPAGDGGPHPGGRPLTSRVDSSLLTLRPDGTYERRMYATRADAAPDGADTAQRQITRVQVGRYALQRAEVRAPSEAGLVLFGPGDTRVHYAILERGALLESMASPGSGGAPAPVRGTAPGALFRYRRRPE